VLVFMVCHVLVFMICHVLVFMVCHVLVFMVCHVLVHGLSRAGVHGLPRAGVHGMPRAGSWSATSWFMVCHVLGFMVCHVPAKVVQIAWSYRRASCATPEFFVRELSVVFELLASSVNFLVYCVFLRRFRQRFVAAASCARRTDLAAGSIT